MIDLAEFQMWILELANGRQSIPNHEFFYWTDKEHREWFRPNVTSILRYCVNKGIVRMGPVGEIILLNISADIRKQFTEDNKKEFKKRDPDAYLQQKELGDWSR